MKAVVINQSNQVSMYSAYIYMGCARWLAALLTVCGLYDEWNILYLWITDHGGSQQRRPLAEVNTSLETRPKWKQKEGNVKSDVMVIHKKY